MQYHLNVFGFNLNFNTINEMEDFISRVAKHTPPFVCVGENLTTMFLCPSMDDCTTATRMALRNAVQDFWMVTTMGYFPHVKANGERCGGCANCDHGYAP